MVKVGNVTQGLNSLGGQNTSQTKKTGGANFVDVLGQQVKESVQVMKNADAAATKALQPGGISEVELMQALSDAEIKTQEAKVIAEKLIQMLQELPRSSM